MVEFIREHRPALELLCRQHHVRTLEVFGSAAGGGFDPVRSDVDFLVDFMPLEPAEHARAYFGLWFALEDLLRRRVDLVETRAVQNPYFLASENRARQVLYAA
jgi:predicted nucleotidyltransferase